jgi:DNA-binding SARP family transcriptional activator
VDEQRFPGRQGRILFAYLAAQNGRPVPRDELAELLWSEELPATWEKALRVLMTKLRALLEECGIDGSTALTSAFGCYKLTLPAGTWIDVNAAVDSVGRAEAALAAGDLAEAHAQATVAAALSRRSFLPGEEGSWVEEKRGELRGVLVRSLECLRDASFASGEFPEAVRHAEEVTELEPFRESGYRRLMEAHAAAGNPAEALRVYERCRRFLADELGAYPSPETEAAYLEILRAERASTTKDRAPVGDARAMAAALLGSSVVEVIGRQAELANLHEFLVQEPTFGALVLVGGPGVGKTTLWRTARDAARERGFFLLSAAPSETEAQLSFSALADLLDEIDLADLEDVPPLQRRALDVALLRAEPVGAPPDPHAIAAGLLNALRALSARERLLVAIDDVHWLDPPSASALTFAVRRLEDHPVRFLLTARPGGRSTLLRALEAEGLKRLDVGSLSLAATRRLLSERLGVTLSRRALRRVFDLTNGNPLFVVELGRVLSEHGAVDQVEEIPLPDAVDDLLGVRVARLPGPARTVLLAIALSGAIRISELVRVVEVAAIDDALENGLLLLEGERVRPSHPLLAAAVKRSSTARERRQLHRELAAAVGSEELKAKHLALANVVPSLELGGTIAAAATAAVGRGAVQEAVELAEHALRLTPPEAPEHTKRLLALAECLVIAGQEGRLTDLLAPRIDELPTGEARAQAHLLLGEAADLAGHEDRLERALAEAEVTPALRATALATKARLLASVRVEQIAEAEVLASGVLPAARAAGVEVEWRAIRALAWARVLRGRPIDDLRQGLAARSDDSSLQGRSIGRIEAVRLAFRGEVDEARARFTRLRALAEERGEGRLRRGLHVQLCELELRIGNAEAAARLLDEWDEWTALESTGYTDWARSRCQALLAAARGLPEEAERWASETLARAEERGEGWDALEARRALGIAALLTHDAQRAAEKFGVVWEHMRREGVDDPGAFPVAPDLVEALADLGAIDEALTVEAGLRALAEGQEHPWGLASLRRCRAMIRLAQTYDETDVASLLDAADAYQRLGLWFDRARSLLALGRAQRRHRKRGEARAILEQAGTAFDQLGAPGWAEETRAELTRVASPPTRRLAS